MASTGGNLLQRTRCFYFYDVATPCNKREPGSGCSAINGINRIHAILGTSEACIATHPSDMCVALAALEAKVHVAGPAGERASLFLISTDCPATHRRSTPISRRTRSSRRSSFRRRASPGNYSYLKIRDRLSYAFALVSVAAGIGDRGRHDQGRAPRARRRRAQTVAQPRGGSGITRSARRFTSLCESGRNIAARRQGLRAQYLQN